MSTRTPAEIFEEVLDAWDDHRRAVLLAGWDNERELQRHEAQVRAYREEFREAEQARIGLVAGSPLESKHLRDSIRASAREYERRPAPLTRAQFPRGDGGEPERPDERGERLSALYTKDDGSAK